MRIREEQKVALGKQLDLYMKVNSDNYGWKVCHRPFNVPIGWFIIIISDEINKNITGLGLFERYVCWLIGGT
ncbi:hypothetical protein G9A89_006791 [Geosiphon pyriformis]|nr:hypothetical protein G9A89_006791 [Geosiphon pyriformis]